MGIQTIFCQSTVFNRVKKKLLCYNYYDTICMCHFTKFVFLLTIFCSKNTFALMCYFRKWIFLNVLLLELHVCTDVPSFTFMCTALILFTSYSFISTQFVCKCEVFILFVFAFLVSLALFREASPPKKSKCKLFPKGGGVNPKAYIKLNLFFDESTKSQVKSNMEKVQIWNFQSRPIWKKFRFGIFFGTLPLTCFQFFSRAPYIS